MEHGCKEELTYTRAKTGEAFQFKLHPGGHTSFGNTGTDITQSISAQAPNFWVRKKAQSNAEVDLLYAYNKMVIPIEIKSNAILTKKLKKLIVCSFYAFFNENIVKKPKENVAPMLDPKKKGLLEFNLRA